MKSNKIYYLEINSTSQPFNPFKQESGGSNVKMQNNNQTTKTFMFWIPKGNPETKHITPRKNPSINIFIVIVPNGKHTPGGLSNQDPLRVRHS
jgi:hypothetical protein